MIDLSCSNQRREAVELAIACAVREARECCVARLGGGAGRSQLGAVARIGAGTAWPELDGRPMVGVAELYLDEVPWLPDLLVGYERLALFVADADQPTTPSGWHVCLDRPGDRLVELGGTGVGVSVRWEALTKDHARQVWQLRSVPKSLVDALDEASTEELDAFYQGYHERVGVLEGMKLGGYPSVIQYGPPWESWNRPSRRLHGVETVLQLSSVPGQGLSFVDGGVLWLGARGSGSSIEWFLEMEFH